MNNTKLSEIQKTIDDYFKKESTISDSIENHIVILIKDLDKIIKIISK